MKQKLEQLVKKQSEGTAKELASLLSTTPATARKYLNQLVAEGVLEVKKVGRSNTYYVPEDEPNDKEIKEIDQLKEEAEHRIQALKEVDREKEKTVVHVKGMEFSPEMSDEQLEQVGNEIADSLNFEPIVEPIKPKLVLKDHRYDQKAKAYMKEVGVEHFWQLTKAEQKMLDTVPVTFA